MYKIDIFENHRFNKQVKETRFGSHIDKVKRLNNHPSIFKKNDNFNIQVGQTTVRNGSIHYKLK
jgi:hypothetical protein